MMWHSMAQKGLFKPCLRLGLRESAQYPTKNVKLSTSLHPLYFSPSPLHVQEVGHSSGKGTMHGDAWNRRLQDIFDRLLLQLQKEF